MRRKFYRGRLATIVWDPAAERSLAEFKDGQFETTDDEVAEKLLSLGYKEVGLKDLRPPVLPEDPIQAAENVKVLSGGMSEKVELANLEAQKEVASAGPETAIANTEKKGGSKKSITRRTKK